jgi:hypothetical protein
MLGAGGNDPSSSGAQCARPLGARYRPSLLARAQAREQGIASTITGQNARTEAW